VEIPLKIRVQVILKELKEWSVIWFQDNALKHPGPHWYIIIPTPDPSHFLLNMITSQGDNRIKYYKNTRKPQAAKCLVKISNDEFEFLSLNSVIDCNGCERLSAEEIIHRMDEATGFNQYPNKIPAYLKKEIVSAIMGSPLIAPFIQKIAKTTNPL
jgi:hypothetical protein